MLRADGARQHAVVHRAALCSVLARDLKAAPARIDELEHAVIHSMTCDAAYLRGVEDGKAQGWQECEMHYRPLLLELQREKAVLETRRQLAFSEGVQAGQAMALYEDPAWARKAARRAS